MPKVDTEPGPVVAGFDGSQASRRAARWAAREAYLRERALVLVTVLNLPVLPEPEHAAIVVPGREQEALRARTEADLAGMAADCRQVWPGVAVETLVGSGRAPEVLARVAENSPLLVIGASGLTGLPRVLLGSTAAELLHQHRRPIVVARGGREQAEGDRVVVGVDGSRVSAQAIGFAFDFADRHGCELVAVHAWSDLPMDALAPVRTWDYDWREVREKGDRLLAESLAGYQQRHPDVPVRSVVALDRPSHALYEHAQGAALLVVGSHGRGAIRRALLGSVSHAMAYHAPCPVAVVHHKCPE